MLKRILLPLDGSQLAEIALPHALACAQATRSRLILAHVLQTGNNDPSKAQTVDPLDWRLRKLETSRYLEQKAELLLQEGVEVETVVLLGEAAERIVEYAQEVGADLIVMSSHGQSGLSPWNVSSVVQKVILTTYSSLMIIPAYRAPNVALGELQYRRIVAPLDGSQRAECVIPLLRTLSQKHDAEISLVTAVARPEMIGRTPLSSEDATLVEKLVARNRAESEKYLAQVASRIDNNVTSSVLVSEDVIATLYEFVKRQEADLVVFSAHGSSGNRDRRYGSTVTSFIVYGSTPLLIVQDLPPQKIRKTEAEVVAQRTSNFSQGERMVINAPAAV